MSRLNTPDDSSIPDLELKLGVYQPTTPAAVSSSSSCSRVSLEMDPYEVLLGGSRTTDAKLMVLVGCRSCLVYAMLSGDRIRCPRYKSAAVVIINVVEEPGRAVT
ncbi:hypothetical protein MLD38_015998 [Melastoma candidum]|uniref:Uncharacterized protein n=1 Tax=Melastoma candidum TaxID=119954 RepID=A0ACB9RL23_9MYRT|nr:hypothetical protein MLD38_015998 [Melastoma candidum]